MKSTLYNDSTVTPLQAKPKNGASVAPPASGLTFIDNASVQRKENKTGMPDQLKSGVESLSGIDMSDVKVHYNSSQPAQLNAHAYAQGNQIHIAPGQEKHLPHEAWHVVQQKQGRVKPTMQMKEKVNVNDDLGLEKEADVMGVKAVQNKSLSNSFLQKKDINAGNNKFRKEIVNDSSQVIQGIFYEITDSNDLIWHWGPVVEVIWRKKLNNDDQVLHNGYGVWERKTKSTGEKLSYTDFLKHQAGSIVKAAPTIALGVFILKFLESLPVAMAQEMMTNCSSSNSTSVAINKDNMALGPVILQMVATNASILALLAQNYAMTRARDNTTVYTIGPGMQEFMGEQRFQYYFSRQGGQVSGLHAGMDAEDITHIELSTNRTVSDRIAIANGAPDLKGVEVAQLAGVHSGIDVSGLIKIGKSSYRTLSDRIDIANGVTTLTADEVIQLAGVHPGMNVAGLIKLGKSTDRSLTDRITIANGETSLTATNVIKLAKINTAIDVAGLIEIGKSTHRTLANRIAIARGATKLTADQVVRLAGVHTGIDVAGLIKIASPGARPLANQIDTANAFKTLNADEIVEIGKVPVAKDLSNTIITSIGKVTHAVIHSASLAQRQAVLANNGLLAALRTGSNPTVLMSSLLEGSQKWINPTENDFFDYFVTKRGTGQLPNTASMNCWESVLYAEYLAKVKTADQIRAFYDNATSATDPNKMIWQSLGFHKGLKKYKAGVTMPKPGDYIFYLPQGKANPSHIALSLGGDNAQSLWHSPNNIDSIQRIKVNDLHVANDTIYFK
jgi:hypothetical protein